MHEAPFGKRRNSLSLEETHLWGFWWKITGNREDLEKQRSIDPFPPAQLKLGLLIDFGGNLLKGNIEPLVNGLDTLSL